jgi:putative spermidine/putrescine transport system permease protein
MNLSVSAPTQAIDLRAGAATLKAQLRRRRWIERAKAIGLVAPLFVFLLVIFVVPIGLLLTRGIDNGDAALILPRTHDVLATWPGDTLPTDAAFDALGADFKSSKRDAVAEIAKRLNYYQPGLRSLILSTSRALGRVDAPPYKKAFLEADASWGEVAPWRAIKRTLPAYTDFYLLAAMDLQRDDRGQIVAAPAESAVYRAVLVRTFAISLSVTLICLLLGYPLAYLIATAPSRTANILLLFVLLPFWTSLLVRTTAWVVLLQTNGVVNSVLAWLGVTGPEGLTMIYNRVGVLIAMTHILS